MRTKRGRRGFARDIICWQKAHGRHDLPWQDNPSPYRVWVSEVMLQQTQAATAAPYFRRFVARFPGVQELAAASPDEVMSLWSGLGYYARARNLHACARIIVDEHGGEFPRTLHGLERLPGIGQSTAGAILSLAFGEPHPVLDANVARVLARILALDEPVRSGSARKALWELAGELQPCREAAAYAQGMMDLGALVCRPAAPLCDACPVEGRCLARARGVENQIPVQLRLPKKRELSSALAVILRNRRVLLARRPHKEYWGGLWAPPIFDSKRECLRFAEGFRPGQADEALREPKPLRVEFTHMRISFAPIFARAKKSLCPPGFSWHSLDRLDSIGLPSPIKALLAPLGREKASPRLAPRKAPARQA